MGASADPRSRLAEILTFLYGDAGEATLRRLDQRLGPSRPGDRRRFTERDAVLIAYGDMVTAPGESPLRALGRFLEDHAAGVLSAVHLLPFYPWSSDDGFSVIDYRQVDPAIGTWADVEAIGRRFDLMVDAVINHMSVESDWFQGFLAGDPRYADFFQVVDPDTDLTAVFRPRALPLLTPFAADGGTRHVWTTFSADQADLNYANPEVFLAVVDVLLDYVAHGASLIRLDAVGFLWKTPGTTCIHLEETHAVIRALRLVLDMVAPDVTLITETNVPHEDNVSYFGDGTDEAQMVYNFSLPPLTLHAFHAGSAEILGEWASALATPSPQTTFFNFLASHDGIGVTPAHGWLNDAEISAMAERVVALGGHVSERATPDGGRRPYELNIGYIDALADPDRPHPPEVMADRLAAAHAIAFSLPGVPGVYFHSLVGSRSWPEGVAVTGRARTINRQKLPADAVAADLADPSTLRYQVYSRLARLLRARAGCAGFDPSAGFVVEVPHRAVLQIERAAPDGSVRVRCFTNVSPSAVSVETAGGTDLVSGRRVPAGRLELRPYGVAWIREDEV